MAIFIIVSIVFAILFMAGVIYLNHYIIRSSDFQCNKCGTVFSINNEEYEYVTMHKFGSLYLKCPHCEQMCWAHPVPKKRP